jgi:hypothetical protein
MATSTTAVALPTTMTLALAAYNDNSGGWHQQSPDNCPDQVSDIVRTSAISEPPTARTSSVHATLK